MAVIVNAKGVGLVIVVLVLVVVVLVVVLVVVSTWKASGATRLIQSISDHISV